MNCSSLEKRRIGATLGYAGPTILLRVREVNEQNFKALSDIAAKLLGARRETGPFESGRHQFGSVVPLPTTTSMTCSTVQALLSSGITSTSVVSSANAASMAVEEATSGELHEEAQLHRTFIA